MMGTYPKSRLVALFVVLNLAAVPFLVKSIGESRDDVKSISIRKGFENPLLKNDDLGYYVEVEGIDTLLREDNRPPLPVYRKTFLLPLGSKVLDIRCKVSQIHTMDLSGKRLARCPGKRWIGIEDVVTFEGNSSPIYPEGWYNCRIGGGIWKEKRYTILTVELYPVRYDLKNNRISFVNNIDLVITYKEGKGEKATGNYDLLVITPSAFLKQLERLARHKDSRGIRTKILTLDEIYSKYTGYDDAEKIKKAIKDEIEKNGIRYVLLVGSIDKLPIRKTHFVRRWNNNYYNTTVLTDLYYADVYDSYGNFCSWDSNGNGRYGEIFSGVNVDGKDDEIDLYPDVYLGRLACKNIHEVRITVNKIIQYEKRTGKWFKRLLVIGGDTFPGWGVIEGEFVTEKTIEILSDFTPTRLWASLGNLNPLNIEIELNKGYGFVHYSGHGFEYGFATHPVGSNEWIGQYLTPYALGLLNGYRLPVIFLDACLTAKLDFNSSDLREYGIPVPFDMTFPCFAWFLVKKSMGGAIATIGATRVAFTNVDSSGVHGGASRLALDFFSSYHNTTILGEMFTEAQLSYLEKVGKDYFTLEEFILLGDPSLKVGGYGL